MKNKSEEKNIHLELEAMKESFVAMHNHKKYMILAKEIENSLEEKDSGE